MIGVKTFKRSIRFIFLTIALFLCACQNDVSEVSEWIIREEAEGSLQIVNTIRLPADMDSRYMICKRDAVIWLSGQESEYLLHFLPFREGEEKVTVLQYPEPEGGAELHLRGVYADAPETDVFWTLWETDPDAEDGKGIIPVRYDMEGRPAETVELNAPGIREKLLGVKDIIGKDDCLYLLTDEALIVWTKDGRVTEIGTESDRCQLVMARENIFLAEFDDTVTRLKTVTAGAAQEIYEIPVAGESVASGENGEIFLSAGTRLFACDTAGKTAQAVADWTAVGISVIRSLTASGEEMAVLTYENGGYVMRILGTSDQVDGRAVVTLMSTKIYDSWLLERVAEFNESNLEYRVVIESPSDAYIRGEESYEDMQTKIQLALASPNPPDLIDMSDVERWADYAKNDAFEDLSPWMEQSLALQEADRLPGALAAGRAGEKQIFIPYAFTFTMLYGKEQYLDTGMGWTLREMLDMGERHEGISMMNGNPAQCLRYLLGPALEEFVDFSGLECDFENQLFYDLLQCAAQAEQGTGMYEHFYDDIVNETALTDRAILFNMESYLGYTGTVTAGSSGGEVQLTLKGYPSKDGRPRGVCVPVVCGLFRDIQTE